jgi:hypothetical protein
MSKQVKTLLVYVTLGFFFISMGIASSGCGTGGNNTETVNQNEDPPMSEEAAAAFQAALATLVLGSTLPQELPQDSPPDIENCLDLGGDSLSLDFPGLSFDGLVCIIETLADQWNWSFSDFVVTLGDNSFGVEGDVTESISSQLSGQVSGQDVISDSFAFVALMVLAPISNFCSANPTVPACAALPIVFNALTVAHGAIQANVQVWDPANGWYICTVDNTTLAQMLINPGIVQIICTFLPPECQVDSNCTQAFPNEPLCDTNGYCVECLSAADCAAGETCDQAGACQP